MFARKTLRGAVVVAVLVAAGLGPAVVGAAAPVSSAAPEDRILPTEQYTSDKARGLAQRYAPQLKALNSKIYHCMPWVEVQKGSIGFFKPKHSTQDDRYLSLRIYIDQDPSPAFAQLAMEERASAMFSRYVGPMLRRMAQPPLLADASLDGFTVIVEWQKQVPNASKDRPVHETIAVFVDRNAAQQYVTGTVPITQLAQEARVLGWDGESALGALHLAAWDDNFVFVHKVQNYQLAPGITCP
ncbi:MAG TPA: hypothetical protein VGL09_19870 [Methylomirabilota bacterium]